MKRTALVFGGAVVAAVLVAAILMLAAPRAPQAPPVPDKPRYRESPVLRDKVQRGELPPVEQRLPEQPLVVPPVDGIGRYDSDPKPPRAGSP